MGIIEEVDRKGRKRIAVRKRWPDGSEFHRYVDNKTVGKKLLTKINEAIDTGTWKQLRKDLAHGVDKEITVAKFWERFRDEYCKPRMASWKRYELSFASLNAFFGSVELREFSRKDLHEYIKSRKGKVSDSTINRDIAACKKMFSFAFEVGQVDINPLVRFAIIPVQETAIRVTKQDEFEQLVNAMETPEMQALVAVLGETGMRKSEGLKLQRKSVDLQRGRLILELTKGKRIRYIPLSGFAIEKLASLPVYLKNPYVFVHQSGPRKGKRIVNPDKQFRAGRKAAGLEWVTFHNLRHFRATTWLDMGADPVSVQEKLGHRDIKTTMRYVHYVESRGDRVIREAQDREKRIREREEAKAEMERVKNGGQASGK
jgi:integrase